MKYFGCFLAPAQVLKIQILRESGEMQLCPCKEGRAKCWSRSWTHRPEAGSQGPSSSSCMTRTKHREARDPSALVQTSPAGAVALPQAAAPHRRAGICRPVLPASSWAVGNHSLTETELSCNQSKNLTHPYRDCIS